MPLTTQEPTRRQSNQTYVESSGQQTQNVATYQQPITGIVQGQLVKILATGDQPGHSPVLQCVDDTGKLSWQAASEVTIIDANFLPPNADQFSTILRKMTR